MNRQCLIATFTFIFFLPTTLVFCQERADTPLSLQPQIQTAEWAKSWWMPRHESKLKEKESMKQVDLLFIGDSITHGWENAGKSLWETNYAPHAALNLGFSGDRTEHVLWRIDHGAIDGIAPKVAVIMIGTNNTGHRNDLAQDTADGVSAIIKRLHEKSPETKVLLLAIFPRGVLASTPERVRNTEINTLLKEYASKLPYVTFLDISDEFLHDDGQLPVDIMPDALHPNEKGYAIWAKAMEPSLKTLLQ